MTDQILNGYLEDFRIQQDLGKLDEPALFSHFVTYCVVSKETGASVSLEDLDVDDGQDTGIDSIAILVNDRVIKDKEDIDYFRGSGRLDVEFIFVQSKRTAKFDGGDIGKFLFGVRNFFSAAPTVSTNEAIAAFRDIKDYIYQNAIHLKHAPTCRLFYASTGKWTNDGFLTGRVEHDIKELKKTQLFHDVRFVPLDVDRLKTIYRELRHRVEKEVLFEKHTILPRIDGAEEAYLGILPVSEFLKLIMDDENEIQKSLFYDNVRDFQGGNPVNSEIAETLKNPSTSGSFVILNNGVTIVAKSISKIGASFRVTDYQIVNGCQTSHVCYLSRDRIGENVFVPIKLIVTSDPELANQIIKATNRQTEVKLEAFESLSPFHRTLEEFYGSFAKDQAKRLYYERRSKQYANTSIKPTSITTLASQAKSFLAMFLNEPHSTHRYYGEILESNRDRLFLEKHCPFSYYAAGMTLNRIEESFRTGELDRKWRRFKYHLLLLFRLLSTKDIVPPLEGRKAEEYAEKLCEILWDRNRTRTRFTECVTQLKTKLDTFSDSRVHADRLRAFTNHLLPGPEKQRTRGKVEYWNFERGFGFVTAKNGQDVFVHYTAIRETIHKYLTEGQVVEFDTVQTERGPQARDLQVMPSERP